MGMPEKYPDQQRENSGDDFLLPGPASYFLSGEARISIRPGHGAGVTFRQHGT